VIVSINQPAYLPWPGYFDRIARSDLHIVLDHVQFEKNSFTNRNRIRTPAGWCWLTVPVQTRGRFGTLTIDGLEAAGDGWRRRHWDSLRCQYARAPAFDTHAGLLEGVYRTEWPRLAPLMHTLTGHLLEAFGITTPLRFSSDLAVTGAKDELVLNLCRSVGATTYISGPFGRTYLRLERFRQAGVTVLFHDYRPPCYAQAWPDFVPGLSALDLLLNAGERSREVMMRNQELTTA
jgi:hypothetical protein